MSEVKVTTKKKQKPTLWIREWEVKPKEWRPATEEEIKEIINELKNSYEVAKKIIDIEIKMLELIRKFEENLFNTILKELEELE